MFASTSYTGSEVKSEETVDNSLLLMLAGVCTEAVRKTQASLHEKGLAR